MLVQHRYIILYCLYYYYYYRGHWHAIICHLSSLLFFVVVGDTHKQNRDSPNCKFTCHYINNGRGKKIFIFFHYILLLLLNSIRNIQFYYFRFEFDSIRFDSILLLLLCSIIEFGQTLIFNLSSRFSFRIRFIWFERQDNKALV